jgi:hypothetical protein
MRFYSDVVAQWSVITLAISSFFIFNSASYFSHVSCALFSVGFVYALYVYLEDRHPGFALLSGFLLGMIAITRYYTATLMFLPFILYLFYRYKWKAIPMFIWIGLGAIPCVSFLFWYNYQITGNPLVPVTMWAYQDEALGFVRGHTVMKGIEHIIRWTALLIYWTSPAVLILYVVALWQKVNNKESRAIKPEDYFYVILVAGYFFYYQIGGNQYGPRFFFEAFPFVVVMIVNFVLQQKRKWTLALFAAGICFSIVKFPFINIREHKIVEDRKDLYRLVNERHLSNAVVFVSSHTCVIRPMPIGDLIRNDLNENSNVIYVQDLGSKNSIIIDQYKGKSFYKYDRNPELTHGELTLLNN